MKGIENIIGQAKFEMNNPLKKGIKRQESALNFRERLNSAIKKTTGKSGKAVDKKLMETCVEMESIFVAKMFKEMRKSVHKSEWLHGGFAEDIFEDMLYDEYSLNVSKNSKLGLASMLYDELSRK